MSVTTGNWPEVIGHAVQEIPADLRWRVEVGLPQKVRPTVCRGCSSSEFRIADAGTVSCLSCATTVGADTERCFNGGYRDLARPRACVRIQIRPLESAPPLITGLVTVTQWASARHAGHWGRARPPRRYAGGALLEVLASNEWKCVSFPGGSLLQWTVRDAVLGELGCEKDWAMVWRYPDGRAVFEADRDKPIRHCPDDDLELFLSFITPDAFKRASLSSVVVSLFVNKVHHGDCLDLMREMPRGLVDLIVTSPPYNLLNSTGGGMRSGGALWRKPGLRYGYSGACSDDMPRDEYVTWQRECLREMLRLLPDTGAIFYNHKWRVQDGLLEDQKEIVAGFPVRQIIIWQRAGGINFNLSYFLPTYEVIYLIPKSRKFRLATSDDPERPKKACAVGDVWYVPQDQKNPHPAPFPVEIPQTVHRRDGCEGHLGPIHGLGHDSTGGRNAGPEVDRDREG